jgi:electron transfer flavoprotein alpha/beta subunit
MMAGRKRPTVWTASDIGLDESALAPRLTLEELYVPVSDKQCEFIEGEDEADAGRRLALKLREARLV